MNHRSLLTVGTLTCLLLAAAAAPEASPPKVGDVAPALSLKTMDDQVIDLGVLREKGPVVVVALRGWVGYQCPLCTRQIADLRARVNEFEAKKAQIILVYPGAAAELKQHAEEFNGSKDLPKGFHLVLDPEMKFVNDWRLRWDAPQETVYPSTFVVDKEGKIRFAKISKNHGDRASAKDILAAIP